MSSEPAKLEYLINVKRNEYWISEHFFTLWQTQDTCQIMKIGIFDTFHLGVFPITGA